MSKARTVVVTFNKVLYMSFWVFLVGLIQFSLSTTTLLFVTLICEKWEASDCEHVTEWLIYRPNEERNRSD